MQILMATDGSDSAKAALDFLIRFPFPHDSMATLLTVIDENALRDEHTGELSEDQNNLIHETSKALREEAEQLLQTEAQRLKQTGWTISNNVCTGNPAEEIIRTAEKTQADLVVVGSHGWTGIREFLLFLYSF